MFILDMRPLLAFRATRALSLLVVCVLLAACGSRDASDSSANSGSNSETEDLNSRIIEAIETGDLAAIQSLVARHSVNEPMDGKNSTALAYCALSDRAELAEFLIENGADVHLADDNGTTPLMKAIRVDSVSVVSVLLNADDYQRFTDSSGWTTLHEAAAGSSPEVVGEILSRNPPVNAQTDEGLTPLMTAAMKSSPEVVALLLNAGADATIETSKGKATAARYADVRLAVEGSDDAQSIVDLLSN